MNRRTVQIGEQLIMHLSKDRFEITVIYGAKGLYKIRSDERVDWLCLLPGLGRSQMEKNTTVNYNYVMIVDSTLAWSIYCVKSTEGSRPKLVWRGKLFSQKKQLKKLIGLHEVDGRLLVIFDSLDIFYILLPKGVEEDRFLMNKEFVPYGGEPAYEHQDFSVGRGFFPQEEEYELLLSHYSQISEELGIIFVALLSRASKLSSIFTIEYDRHRKYLLSGRNVLLNVRGTIVGIYPTDWKEVYLIQTGQGFIYWSIQLDKAQPVVQVHREKFISLWTRVQVKQIIQYAAVTEGGKILLLSVSKSAGKLMINEFPSVLLQNKSILQVFSNSRSNEHYFLTKKLDLFLMKNGEQRKILSNQCTQIVKSRVVSDQAYNFLIVKKSRGILEQKVLFGNHLFAYGALHYKHGLMLQTSALLSSGNTADISYVNLTSPLIGLVKVNISLKQLKQAQSKNRVKPMQKLQSNKSFSLSLQKSKGLMGQQTLFLNERYQITSSQIMQLGKKSVSIAKLFQNAIDFIHQATVLSDQLIILAVCEQVHVFDSKLVRKYIYCLDGEIKNLYALNDINVIGVELYQLGRDSHQNQLTVLILEQQRAVKLKNIVIADCCRYFQLQTMINTSDYKLNAFGEKVVICSNDSLHKYQTQKISVVDFDLPLPLSNLKRVELLPLLTFGREVRTTDFLIIFREDLLEVEKDFDKAEVYIGSFSSKYLFKKIDLKQIHVNYERILTLSQVPRDRPLFACRYQEQEGTGKGANHFTSLLLLGEGNFSLWSLKLGRIELDWLPQRAYLEGQLLKIQTISKQILNASKLLPVSKPIFLIATSRLDYFLLHNSRQIYYVFYDQSKMSTISYYSLINDEFSTFRNNLNLAELGDQEFMLNFSQKMVIKDIKYLSNSIIFVLYEYCIIVLEVGVNNSLVVRQELKFGANEMVEVIKIQEFLQNYDEQSIYLRESHGRIYLLQKIEKQYQIVFHSYMDEDVLLFSRLSNWNDRERRYFLGQSCQKKQYEELVLKKDGQLIVKSLGGDKEDLDNVIYI